MDVKEIRQLIKKTESALYDALECKPGCASASKRAWGSFDELKAALSTIDPEAIKRACADAAVKWLNDHPCSHSDLLRAAIMEEPK